MWEGKAITFAKVEKLVFNVQQVEDIECVHYSGTNWDLVITYLSSRTKRLFRGTKKECLEMEIMIMKLLQEDG